MDLIQILVTLRCMRLTLKWNFSFFTYFFIPLFGSLITEPKPDGNEVKCVAKYLSFVLKYIFFLLQHCEEI